MAVNNKRGAGKPFRKGESGNPKGRPKGSENKVTREVKEAILNAFTNVGGEAYLQRVAKKNPAVFCTLLGKVLPLQISGEGGGALKVTYTVKNA